VENVNYGVGPRKTLHQPDNAPGADTVDSVSATFLVPQAVENPVYDEGGRLVGTSLWTYRWDAEDRLVAAESKIALDGGLFRKIECAYDHAGRRLLKKSYTSPTGESGSWTLVRKSSYSYDTVLPDGAPADFGLLVAEKIENGSGSTLADFEYLWGLDLDGSYQGLGGVGGLLAAVDHVSGKTYIPCLDAKGTVHAWADSDATGSLTIAAACDYDPYGRSLGAVPPAVPAFAFQGKYQDPETGLVFFGFRWYDPATAKWLSSDPIQEAGGLNLYAFCQGDPVNGIDSLGCADIRNHLMVGFDMIDQLGLVLTDAELDSFLSGCIYPDMPDIPMNADGGLIPKASPLFVYLQTKEGYDFLNDKYGPRLKRMLGAAKDARDVVQTIADIDDNLGAMLIPMFARKVAEKVARLGEKPRKRFGYWWNQTSYVGPILTGIPYVKNTKTIQTHFGNMAYLHAMGYEATDTADSIQGNLASATGARVGEFRRLMASGDKAGAYFALGQAVHYLTDSWTPAHADRSASGEIMAFFDYSVQDLNKHSDMDNLSKYSPSAYSSAVSNSVLMYQSAVSGGAFNATSFYGLSPGAAVLVSPGMRKRTWWDIMRNGY
jgi:RHS repeat-associated protein